MTTLSAVAARIGLRLRAIDTQLPAPSGHRIRPRLRAIDPRRSAPPGARIALRKRMSAVLLGIAAALAAGGPAQAQSFQSPWVQGLHSRVRLLAGGPSGGRELAGIEIVLDKGFKTYWRNPGDSGLPPRFDWAGSRNAGAIDLRWPVPARTEDAGGTAYTYSDRVVFPLFVTPAKAGEPVDLALALDYGVCKDICIPVHAEVSLTLTGAPEDRGVLKAALARVPQAQALGAPGEVSILSAEPLPGPKPQIAVTVRRPAGTRPVLFPDAPDNWYLSVPPEAEETAPDRSRFLVTVEERPRDASGPIDLRFTLAAGERAVETEVRLAIPDAAR